MIIIFELIWTSLYPSHSRFFPFGYPLEKGLRRKEKDERSFKARFSA